MHSFSLNHWIFIEIFLFESFMMMLQMWLWLWPVCAALGKVQSGFCCPLYLCLLLRLMIFVSHFSVPLLSEKGRFDISSFKKLYAYSLCHGLCLSLVCCLRKCSWFGTLIFRNIFLRNRTTKVSRDCCVLMMLQSRNLF